MELKPIKENKKILYPTISDAKESNCMRNMLLSFAIANSEIITLPEEWVGYKLCNLAERFAIIVLVISLILLIINIFKLKKENNRDEKVVNRIKKHKKIDLICLISGIIVYIIIMIGKIYSNSKSVPLCVAIPSYIYDIQQNKD